MAANYWESTQRKHWQFTRQQLEEMRTKLEDEDQSLVQMFPLPQIRYLSIYLNQRKLLVDPVQEPKAGANSFLQRLLDLENVSVYDNKQWRLPNYTSADST